jgi:hypothetical protein
MYRLCNNQYWMLTCLYVVNQKLYAEKVNMTSSNTIVGTSTYCTPSSSAPFSASHQISLLSRTRYLCLTSKTALSELQQERLSQQATPTTSVNPPMPEQTEKSRGRSCAVCGCPHITFLLPPAEGLPPAGKLHQRTLTAANVCTTSSGHQRHIAPEHMASRRTDPR